ncbi:MAG: hypothetical protein P4L77_07130 [Sulfuriferula sp.]|nr:hypothetical protein [Sulfuriferula sp.]
MAYLLDYIKSRWAPKGSVVTAGVPPEQRVDRIPVTPELISRHLAGAPALPQTDAAHTVLYTALSDPLFLQTGARQLAQQLIANGLDAELETLVKWLTVLTLEVTRQMYIDAARDRDGAIGIRLFPIAAQPEAGIAALCNADEYGLGAGVYPFDAVPANPTPGQTCGFYIRVVIDD